MIQKMKLGKRKGIREKKEYIKYILCITSFHLLAQEIFLLAAVLSNILVVNPFTNLAKGKEKKKRFSLDMGMEGLGLPADGCRRMVFDSCSSLSMAEKCTSA